jgi:rhodanese-related sulfurtransferase
MTTTLKRLMQEAASLVAQVSPAELTGSLDRGEAALILDVRESEEWSRGHIPGSMNVPRGWLELRADAASPIADPTLSRDPRARIVAYCYQAPGVRSLLAATTLIELGYTNVAALSGGLKAWVGEGLPIQVDGERSEH